MIYLHICIRMQNSVSERYLCSKWWHGYSPYHAYGVLCDSHHCFTVRNLGACVNKYNVTDSTLCRLSKCVVKTIKFNVIASCFPNQSQIWDKNRYIKRKHSNRRHTVHLQTEKVWAGLQLCPPDVTSRGWSQGTRAGKAGLGGRKQGQGAPRHPRGQNDW